MKNIPMRFDYSKTINEQLPTFEYYKDRYCSYELQIMNLQQQLEQERNIRKEAIVFLDKVREENGNEIGQVNYETLIEILNKEVK